MKYSSIKKLLTVVSLVLFAANYAFSIDYVVKGKVDNLDGKKLYMFDYDKRENIDSTLVQNGQFEFSGSYERPAFVRIENGAIFSNCVLDTLAIVDFDTHFPSGGSLMNQEILKFNSANQIIIDELNKFAAELRSHGFEQPEFGEIYKRLYDKRRPELLKLYNQTIEDHPDGVGECVLLKLGGLSLNSDEWDWLYLKMPPYLKDRMVAKEFNDMYTNLRKSEPGKPFIDFGGRTIDGNEVKLSDYVGNGKYVLIDFWAAWCGPCKVEADEVLMPLYEKYKDDARIMILGVATWDDPKDTRAFLEKYNYPWPQIIDTDQIPMQLYGFNAIPQIMLISPDGMIVARDIRGKKISEVISASIGE